MLTVWLSLSLIIVVLAVPVRQNWEGFQVIWVIEYIGAPPCWISDRKGSAAAFDVTFQRSLARHFTNREDANCEILRLGLSGAWSARNIGGSR
jgi:hypothetical protein